MIWRMSCTNPAIVPRIRNRICYHWVPNLRSSTYPMAYPTKVEAGKMSARDMYSAALAVKGLFATTLRCFFYQYPPFRMRRFKLRMQAEFLQSLAGGGTDGRQPGIL